MTGHSHTTKPSGYPASIDNPDDWAGFLSRYLDNRATSAAHNGIGLVALHIADAVAASFKAGYAAGRKSTFLSVKDADALEAARGGRR